MLAVGPTANLNCLVLRDSITWTKGEPTDGESIWFQIISLRLQEVAQCYSCWVLMDCMLHLLILEGQELKASKIMSFLC